VTRPGGKLLLLDIDPWRRESLEAYLRAERFLVETEERPSFEPDVTLVNLSERGGEARTRVERIKTMFPKTRIVAFVREVDSHTVFPCLLLGVKGIVPFDASQKELRSAITCVLEGSIWTPRPVLAQWIERIAALGISEAADRTFTRSEQRVLEGLREELSNKEIARRLGVTEATVKFHVGKLLRKTGTKDRRELARFVKETVPAHGPG